MKLFSRGTLSAVFKKAAVGAAFSIAAGTLGIEAVGLHDDLMRKGGMPLTEGEEAIVHSVFGNQIHTGNLRKHFGDPKPPVAASVLATSRRHLDFWGERYQSEDFSKLRGLRLGVFMHEMTHIWQHQNSFILWQRLLHACETYDYELTPQSGFGDFCIEQQAQMVQDYVNQVLYPPFGTPGIHDEADKELARVVEAQFPQARITRLRLEDQEGKVYSSSNGYSANLKL